jgi:hypothetical protein
MDNVLVTTGIAQKWLKAFKNTHGRYPSKSECIWQSPDPLTALIGLSKQILLETTCVGSDQIHNLMDIAVTTRDHELLSNAVTRLLQSEIGDPWKSWYGFLYSSICTNDSSFVADCALRALRKFDDPPEQVVRKALHAIYSYKRDLSIIDEDTFSKVSKYIHAGDHMLMNDAGISARGHDFVLSDASDELLPANVIGFYSSLRDSMRMPFAEWSDPTGFKPEVLSALLTDIENAIAGNHGYSLIRLGDGEGLFLSGMRPDLGGAVSNGVVIDDTILKNGCKLTDDAYHQIQGLLLEAISLADTIGIPDIYQCVRGPVNYSTVSQALMRSIDANTLPDERARLMPGGCHVHNYLLFAGLFKEGVLSCPRAVIGPSLPNGLLRQANITHISIPGEKKFRENSGDSKSHFPFVFNEVIDWIRHNVRNGDVILVGAGILGKIYCSEIKKMGGIAVDIGSVLDITSGHMHTRGEYRSHCYMKAVAAEAFGASLAVNMASSC